MHFLVLLQQLGTLFLDVRQMIRMLDLHGLFDRDEAAQLFVNRRTLICHFGQSVLNLFNDFLKLVLVFLPLLLLLQSYLHLISRLVLPVRV